MAGGGVFLYAAQQNVGGALGKDGGILPDRRQPRHGVPPKRNAVVPGYGNVLRYAQAVVLYGPDGSHRHQVRHGENRRKAGAVGQQVLGSRLAALHREVRKPVLPVKVERHAEPLQGIQTAVQSLLARAGGFGPVADDADDTVAFGI